MSKFREKLCNRIDSGELDPKSLAKDLICWLSENDCEEFMDQYNLHEDCEDCLGNSGDVEYRNEYHEKLCDSCFDSRQEEDIDYEEEEKESD